jgi:hypothetical protein
MTAVAAAENPTMDHAEGVVEEMEADDADDQEEAEELLYDESAYIMYHRAQTGILRVVSCNACSRCLNCSVSRVALRDYGF